MLSLIVAFLLIALGHPLVGALLLTYDLVYYTTQED